MLTNPVKNNPVLGQYDINMFRFLLEPEFSSSLKHSTPYD